MAEGGKRDVRRILVQSTVWQRVRGALAGGPSVAAEELLDESVEVIEGTAVETARVVMVPRLS
jgi:hypothetical protein